MNSLCIKSIHVYLYYNLIYLLLLLLFAHMRVLFTKLILIIDCSSYVCVQLGHAGHFVTTKAL